MRFSIGTPIDKNHFSRPLLDAETNLIEDVWLHAPSAAWMLNRARQAGMDKYKALDLLIKAAMGTPLIDGRTIEALIQDDGAFNALALCRKAVNLPIDTSELLTGINHQVDLFWNPGVEYDTPYSKEQDTYLTLVQVYWAIRDIAMTVYAVITNERLADISRTAENGNKYHAGYQSVGLEFYRPEDVYHDETYAFKHAANASAIHDRFDRPANGYAAPDDERYQKRGAQLYEAQADIIRKYLPTWADVLVSTNQ